jgi:hypothetical protein
LRQTLEQNLLCLLISLFVLKVWLFEHYLFLATPIMINQNELKESVFLRVGLLICLQFFFLNIVSERLKFFHSLISTREIIKNI